MFGISFSELAIIGLLILIVMGPEKLPEVARWAGKGMRELRRASNTLRNALMIDDLDPRQQLDRQIADDRPRPHQPSAVPDKAISPEKTGPPPPDLSGDHPPYARQTAPQGPPVALDQVDDDQFQAMLEQEYRKKSGVRTVSIARAGHSDDLITVFIEPHKSTDEAATVDLRDAEVVQ